MEVLDIRQQIRDRNIDNLYIFTGEEVAIQQAYQKKLADVGGYQLKVLDSVDDLFTKSASSSMFKSKNCYVDDNDYRVCDVKKGLIRVDYYYEEEE